jgi:hypothetical protein
MRPCDEMDENTESFSINLVYLVGIVRMKK